MAQLEERLAANESEGVRAFLAALVAAPEIVVDGIWLTGSKARGAAGADADVDLLVVVGAGGVEAMERIRTLAAEATTASSVRLDVHAIDREEWAQQALEARSLYQAIQANGVPLLDEGGTS